jgi:hypothetical protein
MDFVVQVDFFDGSGSWVFHVTRGLSSLITITEVDIIPMSFEVIPFLIDLFIDVWSVSINIIGSESIGWFRDFFVFNIVNRKSSVSEVISNSPISVFGDTG